jgi:hypothetical protein
VTPVRASLTSSLLERAAASDRTLIAEANSLIPVVEFVQQHSFLSEWQFRDNVLLIQIVRSAVTSGGRTVSIAGRLAIKDAARREQRRCRPVDAWMTERFGKHLDLAGFGAYVNVTEPFGQPLNGHAP